MSIRYTPTNPPTNPEDLSNFLLGELRRLSEIINNIADGHIEISHVEPERPREGDIRFADGTDWNPGNGKGLYYVEKHVDNQGVETYHWHHINHTN